MSPLFGVVPQAEYPERELQVRTGDRFLLYTDGLVEAENSRGEMFGERLPELLRNLSPLGTAEATSAILDELRRWQGDASTQQDDITLVLVDVT
jgi:serine phosphatase RsbU (regulator of sigma subunit)